MKVLSYFKYCFLGFAALSILMACDSKEEPKDTSAELVEYTKIPACDEYFKEIQGCIDRALDQQEVETVKAALQSLGERMASDEEPEVIEELCKANLAQIEEHKKALNCIP